MTDPPFTSSDEMKKRFEKHRKINASAAAINAELSSQMHNLVNRGDFSLDRFKKVHQYLNKMSKEIKEGAAEPTPPSTDTPPQVASDAPAKPPKRLRQERKIIL